MDAGVFHDTLHHPVSVSASNCDYTTFVDLTTGPPDQVEPTSAVFDRRATVIAATFSRH
jgi:hypothetical protein